MDWGETRSGQPVGSRPAAAGQSRTIWRYLPVTVLAIVAFSAVFTVLGVRPVVTPRPDGTVDTLVNLLQTHGANLFMHAGLEHFLVNAVGLVLFGGAFTLLTSNGHVAGVVAVTHFTGSLLVELTTGLVGIGTSLAVAGIIAATIVRTAALFLGRDSRRGLERLLAGLFAAGVVLLFAWTSLSGTFSLPISDYHFWGWLAGGTAEAVWVTWLHTDGR